MAIEGVEGEPVTLTEPAAEAIGAAFARFLRGKVGEDTPLSVSIGHDSRVSADNLKVRSTVRHSLYGRLPLEANE